MNLCFALVDLSLRLTNLEPDCKYSVLVESLANHPNDKDAHSSVKDGFVNRTQSKVQFFQTGQPPKPPGNLRVVSATEDSIKVSWEPPVEYGIPVIRLVMQVWRKNERTAQRHEDAPNSKRFELSADTTSLLVDRLMPKMEYMFSLNAITEDDDAQSCAHVSSAVLSAYTSGLDPPTDLRLVFRTPTSVRVRWQSAVPYGTSRVQHYVVHYVENRHARKRSRGKSGRTKDAGHSVVVESEATEAELLGLDPGTAYRVVVETVLWSADCSYEDDFHFDDSDQASLSSGTLGVNSPPVPPLFLSQPITVCTTAPPEKPVLLLSGLSPSQIHLCWNKPSLLAPGTFWVLLLWLLLLILCFSQSSVNIHILEAFSPILVPAK